jgi:hypothetical protein
MCVYEERKRRILLSSGNNNCKGSKSETEMTVRNIYKQREK